MRLRLLHIAKQLSFGGIIVAINAFVLRLFHVTEHSSLFFAIVACSKAIILFLRLLHVA